ncbi:MAG: hypothetical protein DKINENOH_01670 [bacterium]|nr:hypothetical protein [bacterium]
MCPNSAIRHRSPLAKGAMSFLLGTMLALASGECLAQAGSLDPAFGSNGQVTTDFIGPNLEVGQGVAIAPADGRILVAGYTNDDGGSDFALARYMPDGSLDVSFGTDGRVTTDLGSRVDMVGGALFQPDGKIVVGGSARRGNTIYSDFVLVRYNPDGSLDAGFGNGGKVFTTIQDDALIYAIALQADGKIVAAGYTSTVSYAVDFAVARYNSDGSLDASFGTSGIVITDFSMSHDTGYDVALQADGKIIVTGSVWSSRSSFGLARYNSDGSPDNSFGSNGKLVTSFGPSGGAIAHGVVVQTDGRIVVAGEMSAGSSSTRDLALARYNGDGSLDSGFGVGGKVTTDYGATENYGYGVGLQSDGKIVVAGQYFTNQFRYRTLIARYNTEGSLDTGFDGDGLVQPSFGAVEGAARSIAIQSDDKILVAGSVDGGLFTTGEDFLLARLNNDGSLDPSLDGDGWVATDFVGPNYDYATEVVISPSDGKIVAVGYTVAVWPIDFAVARYNRDGSLDAGFGVDGRVTTDIRTSFDCAARAVVQNDGKIVVAGYTYTSSYPANADFALVRYHTDGSLDPSFGTGGKVTTDFYGDGDFATDIALQGDGKVVVGGYTATSSWRYVMARYNSNGSLDPSFGVNGKVMTVFDFGYDLAYALALQPDGKILIAGQAHIDNYHDGFGLARYNSDGTLDVSFDGDGKLISDFGLHNEQVNALALQPDGKIVAAGHGSSNDATYQNFLVARYNADGSLDVSFDGDGWAVTDFGSQADYAYDVALQSDGRIVLVGSMSFNNTYNVFALARYTNSGMLDASFGSSGLLTTTLGSEAGAKAVALQDDGRMVVAGIASAGSATGHDFALVRYLMIATPQEEIQALMEQVQDLIASGVLNGGQGNALLTKLRAALQQLDKDDVNAKTAINQLEAFINQVDGFIRSGTLLPEEGQPLITAAENAIALIEQGIYKQASLRAAEAGASPAYQLLQNYPNPFNPETEIRFQLPEAGHVVITIFDALGHEIETLADAQFSAGDHRVRWQARDKNGRPRASGVYFYRLHAGRFSEVRRMSLLR